MLALKKLICPLLFIMGAIGCAHTYSEEEYGALETKYKGCEQATLIAAQDAQKSKDQFEQLRGEVRKAREEKEACLRDKQTVLDRNIEALEQNKALLQRITQFKTIMQERKDAAGRVGKVYENTLALLDQERRADQLYIIKNSEKIKIIIPQRVLFAGTRSAWLLPKGNALIEKIAKGLKQIDPGYIEVGGHTDNAPLPEVVRKIYPNNWYLSHARALAVLDVFEAHGIGKNRMCAIAYGDTRPIADNTSEEGMATNRRVEITILP